MFVPNTFFQTVFLATITFIISLIIMAVYDIGNPYKPGSWHISKEDYEAIKTSIINQI